MCSYLSFLPQWDFPARGASHKFRIRRTPRTPEFRAPNPSGCIWCRISYSVLTFNHFIC